MSGADPLDQTLESGDVAIPARFAGRYRVLRPLGRGASKDVYLAHDERLDRDVALALLTGGTSEARVRREMQVTGRLGEHPHVVTVHDAGQHDGITYLVLRAVEGGTLAARAGAAPGRRLPLEDVVRIGRDVADALAHAHAHGVVHRDVKPDNVWLDGAGRAVLGDFGVALDDGGAARLTANHAVVGTLAYLSPEQARGEPATPASDLYGLGATLYELACGRPPFSGESAEALIGQHLHASPAPPSAHELAAAPLDGLLLRLLAKDPRARPPSAVAVRDELDGAAPPPAAPRSGLIGRDRVMAELTAALDDALGGRVRVVALVGEPGIGKTCCVEALAERALPRGWHVMWGACSDEEGAPAYWPWRRGLREAGVDMPELAGGAGSGESPEEARFRLLEAVGDALAGAAAQRPLLVVLEDLHWADSSSLALLAHVARTVRSARLLVVCTLRPAGLEREDMARLAGAPARSRVELGALDRGEVARLAEQVAGEPVTAAAADALSERTLGNPLYVAELVRALAAEGLLADAGVQAVPSGLRMIVGRRVAALPAGTRELLSAAAVAGAEFALARVASAVALSRAEALSALEPAISDRIVAAGPAGGHRFCHAVIRDVVYDDQPAVERAARHAALLAALEERADVPAAELAHHAMMAARGGLAAEPAMRWSRSAAADAARVHGYAEAAGHLSRALEAAELGGLGTPSERLALRLELAAAWAAAGDHDVARDGFAHAAELAARRGDAEAVARAALGFAEFQDYGVTDAPALRLLEQALALLPATDSRLRAEVLGRLAVRIDPAEDQPRREALLEDAVAMARRLGEITTLTRLLALSPLVHWSRPERADRRLADAREVVELAAACGDREPALWALIVLHAERFAAGDIAGADSELAAYERHAQALHQPYYRWYGTVMRATRAIFDGRLAEGARLARAAVAENREHEADAEQEWVVQELLLARLRGRPDEVPLAPLRAYAERYAHLPLWPALLALGEWVAGDTAAARTAFEAVGGRGFASLPADADRLCTLALLADVCAALGDRPRARELYELLEPYAERNVLTDRSWAAWGAVARPLGRLAATAGDTDRATRAFERALDLHRRWAARPWLAHTLLDRAEALPDGEGGEEGRALAAELGLAHIPSSTNPAQ